MIRVPTKQGYTSGQVAEEVMKVIHQKTPEAQLTRTEYVGPQVGEELARDGGTALALVVAGIMIYLAFRFEWKFSVAAIIANLHDIFIVLGIFSVMQWEFSLPVLAAVLAVLGYSVNESVIIFDPRPRALPHDASRRHDGGHQLGHYGDDFAYRDHAYVDALHDALDVLLRRSGAHYFSLALTIGILLGVYSSVFVAAAIALYLGVKREDLVRPVKKDEVEEMVP